MNYLYLYYFPNHPYVVDVVEEEPRVIVETAAKSVALDVNVGEKPKRPLRPPQPMRHIVDEHDLN